MQALISPHYPPEKLQNPIIEDLVDVLEDRLRFWLLEPAKELASHQFGQVAGFALLLTYFEGIWSYIQGQDSRRNSGAFFKSAFVDTFESCGLAPGLLERIAVVLYEDARCGFFHDGLFRHRIFFGKVDGGCLSVTLPCTNGVLDEAGEIQSIIVDVEGVREYIEGHLEKFLSLLRDSSQKELRERFKAFCQQKWDYEGNPVSIAL